MAANIWASVMMIAVYHLNLVVDQCWAQQCPFPGVPAKLYAELSKPTRKIRWDDRDTLFNHGDVIRFDCLKRRTGVYVSLYQGSPPQIKCQNGTWTDFDEFKHFISESCDGNSSIAICQYLIKM